MKILLIACFCLAGCAPFNHHSDYTFTGTNIKSAYGTGDVNIHIVGDTSYGKCPITK
jgi:hypothetical protein